jgi:hypothetical protein
MGARAGLEADQARTHARGCRRFDDRFLPDDAGETVGRTAARRHRTTLFNVHNCFSPYLLSIAAGMTELAGGR